MNESMKIQLIEFLVKHHFVNPTLVQYSESLSGALYCAEEENGRRTTIKIFNTKKLEEMYQLQQQDFFNFIKYHTLNINNMAKRVACPELISLNNSFVQSYKDLLFYMMEFIPGSDRNPSSLSLEQKKQIAKTLATIHQTDIASFKQENFTRKAYFFAQAWQTFIQGNGIALINTLAKEYIGCGMKKFIDRVSKVVTYDSILRLCQNQFTVLTHSDIKPKNVIWNSNDQFFIIDWDELCLSRAEADFVDTVTSWVVQKNDQAYSLDMSTAKIFRDAYKRPLSLEDIDVYISAAKWMFWVMTCYYTKNQPMLIDGLLMLQMLDNHYDELLALS